jgi:hypothetical protein
MILTCRTPDGRGSGWAGITGVKDLSLIDPVRISEIAADKAVKSQKPRALEPGRYTVILESRPAARFLSLMTGIFNARAVETGPRSYLTGTEKGTSKLGQKVFSHQSQLLGDGPQGRRGPDADVQRRPEGGADGKSPRPRRCSRTPSASPPRPSSSRPQSPSTWA